MPGVGLMSVSCQFHIKYCHSSVIQVSHLCYSSVTPVSFKWHFQISFSNFRSVIDGEPLRFRGEVYHPYHFNCTGCSKELTSSAIEVKTRPGYTANELVGSLVGFRKSWKILGFLKSYLLLFLNGAKWSAMNTNIRLFYLLLSFKIQARIH